jgi:hypothetical protein
VDNRDHLTEVLRRALRRALAHDEQHAVDVGRTADNLAVILDAEGVTAGRAVRASCPLGWLFPHAESDHGARTAAS